MASPGRVIVFVHGGMHDHRCWQPTLRELQSLHPDATLRALDLSQQTTLSGCIDVVVEQTADLDRFWLVGHSVAGITVPSAAARIGAERLAGVVLIAALVPAPGRSALQELPPPLGPVARAVARSKPVLRSLPRPLVHHAFGSDMTSEQRTQLHACLVPQHLGPPAAAVDPGPWPDIERIWVLTLRDRTLSVRKQRRFIENLGGVDQIVAIDAGHDAMISAPRELAGLLARVTK